MISKIEHGTRGLPAALWRIADDLCRAEGVLVAEHSVLEQAERDNRERCRPHPLGRRDAIQLAGSVLAAAGLSGLDAEEYTRLARAVDSPRRSAPARCSTPS
jgi:hypothetical protein